MKGETIRVALAGSPQSLTTLLASLRDIEDAVRIAVVALCTSDRKDAGLRAELARFSEEPTMYLRLEEVLANETVHAVCLASPVPYRHTHTEAALFAGCHVLVASPLAVTVRGASRAVAAAQESERLLAVFRSSRFTKHAHVLKWAVANQAIGRLQYVLDIAFGAEGISPNACFGDDPKLHDRTQGGGLLLCQTVRDFAFLRCTCGDVIEIAGQEATLEPERVLRDASGAVRQRFACHAEDTIGAHLRFASNACGQYLRSWAGRGSLFERRLCIWGSGGAIQDGMIVRDNREAHDLEEDWKEHVGAAEIERLFPGGLQTPRTLELLSFFSAVRSWEAGKPVMPPHAGREALRDIATTWAAAEAARLGKRVTVSDVENLIVEEAQKDLNARWKIS